MEAISSIDADVSSSAAAWLLAPVDSDCAEPESCDAADATCSAPAVSSRTEPTRMATVARTMKNAIVEPAIRATIRAITTPDFAIVTASTIGRLELSPDDLLKSVMARSAC